MSPLLILATSVFTCSPVDAVSTFPMQEGLLRQNVQCTNESVFRFSSYPDIYIASSVKI